MKTLTKEEQKEPPAKTEPVAKGELVASLVKNAIEKHGQAKEQTTLQLFEEDPATYEEALKKVLTYLAQRNPAFATELQTLAQQANIQTGGSQGTVNVSEGGTVYGPTAGTNYGTMSGTYTLPDGDTRKVSTD